VTDPLEGLAASMADALEESGVPPKPKHAGGRRSKRDEQIEILAKLGVPDPASVVDSVTDVPPPPSTEPVTLDGVRAQLLQQLGGQIPTLKGNALVNAYRAVEALARVSPGEDAERDPLIAEVVTGAAGLPAERRREILEGELARLEVERVAIEEALEGCVVA
jgi:hypothetical protein